MTRWLAFAILLLVTSCSYDFSTGGDADATDSSTSTLSDPLTDSDPPATDTATEEGSESATGDTDTRPDCVGMRCNTPEPNQCDGDDALEVWNSPGWCDQGECRYASHTEACASGLCAAGVCSAEPCQGVTCATPPQARCADEATLQTYQSDGKCEADSDGEPQCFYEGAIFACDSGCAAAQCLENPCAGVVCRTPPARYCQGDALIVYDTLGRCEGAGGCGYGAQPVICGLGGCAQGRCVNDNPCEHVTCDTSPARYCVGDVLRTFAAMGSCEQGGCLYAQEDIVCAAGCAEGACLGEPCAGVSCNEPPSAYCKTGSTLVSWDGEPGQCVNGVCTYGEAQLPCEGACEAGACTEDPCAGVFCARPPAAHCDAATLVQYASIGECMPGGWCSYDEARENCPNGCANATCLPDADTDTVDTSSDTVDTGSDTVDTGSDTVDTSSDTDTTPQCSGQPDFTSCTVITVPDRSYDICVAGQCVSPGCGNTNCNVPGPHFSLADTNQRFCCNNSSTMKCPSAGQSFYGQDAQYGWDKTHSESERYTRTIPVTNEPIVEDRVTGLVWQGCSAGLSGSSCGAGSASALTWSDALRTCDSLTWGGATDWRLPDSYELVSIVDSGRYNPAIDPAAFPGTPNSGFWSSSTHAVNWGDAWRVVFSHGYVSEHTKTAGNQVRCVRGGPFHARRFEPATLLGDRMVSDTGTGLQWQGCAAGLSGPNCATGNATSLPWSGALSYCEGLSYASHTDWRLPSRAELQSIVDQRTRFPAIDAVAFPGTPRVGFWSSSSYASYVSNAWEVDFEDGAMLVEGKSNVGKVRCVRSSL
ncbi:MAG: DUF1566 domain-containing protein [Polyangiaceae bacterium]|nr:DUF1566 domain-containing protein [Polyangiaceae bacterium]